MREQPEPTFHASNRAWFAEKLQRSLGGKVDLPLTNTPDNILRFGVVSKAIVTVTVALGNDGSNISVLDSRVRRPHAWCPQSMFLIQGEQKPAAHRKLDDVVFAR